VHFRAQTLHTLVHEAVMACIRLIEKLTLISGTHQLPHLHVVAGLLTMSVWLAATLFALMLLLRSVVLTDMNDLTATRHTRHLAILRRTVAARRVYYAQ